MLPTSTEIPHLELLFMESPSITNPSGVKGVGEVGTILGRHGVNIANFALGRNTSGAIGVVTVDEDPDATSVLEAAVVEIRRVPAIREASVIRLTSTS